MRLTFLYPEEQEDFAQKALKRLARLSQIDVAIVAIGSGNLRQELLDNSDGDEPLVLLLSRDLVAQERGSARVLWAPLLGRVEAGASQSIGILLLDDLVLPPLLQRSRWARGLLGLRELESWAISWSLPENERNGADSQIIHDLDAGLLELMLECLVDESALLKLSCPCASTRTIYAAGFAALAGRYFEAIHNLFVPHRVAALRDEIVARISGEGRVLWILDGYEGPVPVRPESASILVLGASGGIAIPAIDMQPVEVDLAGVVDRSLELIALIPNTAGIELPFSTFEFEEVLPQLFGQHWVLAERLARKAGVFFRVNFRVGEALWLYEELRNQAELQGKANCVQDCDNELYWLRAGGNRKLPVSPSDQGSFEF